MVHMKTPKCPAHQKTKQLTQARYYFGFAGLQITQPVKYPPRTLFFFFSVLGLFFYENRKEKGKNGEDNKDNKMNRKMEMEKRMTKKGRV